MVIGASGFIGTAFVTELRRRGMVTRCVVRDRARVGRRFPDSDVRALDLTTSAARDQGCWAALLKGMDAVVNAAGVFQPPRTADAWAVHRDAPAALYRACERAGVRRILHVSAVGVSEANTTYAQSKREGERSLMERDLDWTVLRPPLVVDEDSYGGTPLLRAIAAFPFVTPVIGDGTTLVDVIHKEDLAPYAPHHRRRRRATPIGSADMTNEHRPEPDGLDAALAHADMVEAVQDGYLEDTHRLPPAP